MTCSGALDEGWSRAETTATWAEIHLLSSPSLAPLAGLSVRRFGLTKGCHTLLGRWLFRTSCRCHVLLLLRRHA